MKLPLRKTSLLLFIIFILQVIVNFVGALGPELSFDALWYHLTLPKLFLENHKIFYIPGGLFYYSVMPKLGEMFYLSSLAFGSEIFAKIIHFSFGILCCLVLYKIARKYLSVLFSLVVVIIFYSNLVVAWESTTAYIDLIRTFFELVALFYWLRWVESKKNNYFIFSAITLGFAVTTKLVSLSSLCIFVFLTFIELKRVKATFPTLLKKVIIYICIVLLVPLPWFAFSFITTRNPFYPFFTPVFQGVNEKIISTFLLNPMHFFTTYWQLFTHASDPISPLYIALLPLAVYAYRQFSRGMKYISIYTLLSFLLWYSVSQVEGSRLVIPCLASGAIIIVYSVTIFLVKLHKQLYQNVFIGLVCITAIISVAYRSVASFRYIPVILGKESKSDFLKQNLRFSFGDFYDYDNYFKTHIKQNDMVVLSGFHNEFYIDFPSIDSSYITKGTRYNYVAVQNGSLPRKLSSAKLIYINPTTRVKLYFVGNKIWQ